ncbi:cell division protein PerM [Halostreptopolyspora alba]|uniref:Integral membrane protein n=1 Tax=Halostreptopolyspora alba TaxID=2487137 RepID=A0A3N0E396_9ACTN|nr:hypothetical protein EFW17_19455 [Nocardiopsaceae bacterium YIM 96095]
MGGVSAPTRPSEPRGRPRGGDRPPREAQEDPPRSLYTAGGIAAASASGIGVAVLMTFTVIGWVAAPHGTLGEDIADVFRTTVQAWLVGHLVGFAIPGGHVAMLPLGLVVLPGILLFRSGRRLARSCELSRPPQAFRAALALAGPYAAICGTLALVGHTEAVRPSMVQALVAGFVLAFVAGGLGALRQVLRDSRISVRRLLRRMPSRARSLLVGTLGATGVLLVAGAGLFGVALVVGLADVVAITRELSPGIVGGTLLVVGQLLYLPNAVIFGTSYAVGPGFAIGTDTMVAPTGVAVGPVPLFPVLGALPENGAVPAYSLVVLAAPFLAGATGGVLTQRSMPAAASESVPLWGLACGATTGLVFAVFAALAGGPLGAERLTEVGPSPWQVGVATALEVGVTAALAAWVSSWWHYRRARLAAADPPEADTRDGEPVEPEAAPVTGSAGGRGPGRRWPRLPSWRPRLPAPRGRRLGPGADDADDEDAAELFGISYEAVPGADGADDPGPAAPEAPKGRD